MPSNGRQHTCRVSTPPASMSASTSRPTSLSTRAVTTAVRSPKQRRRARATLYSPPPSHTSNDRAVRMRPLPGSRRSITSPTATQSQRDPSGGRIDRVTGAALRRRRAHASVDGGRHCSISSIAARARADRSSQRPAATSADGTSCDPRPRHAAPASSHGVTASRVGAMPPVGIRRDHGQGASTSATKLGPSVRAGKTLTISAPSTSARITSPGVAAPGM